jgi:hypothetical protein
MMITLMIEAARTSEMTVNFYQTTGHNPEDSHICSHYHKNLKSYNLVIFYNIQITDSSNTFTDFNIIDLKV